MFISSKNTVREAILNNKNIKCIYFNNKNHDLYKLANDKNIIIKIVEPNKLDKMVQAKHQGVVAEVEDYKYCSLEDIINNAKSQFPLIVMLDGIEDPHNLGAILRTCDAANVDGVIIPKNRNAHLNETVARVSTGAIEYVKVAEVTNLNQTIQTLKDKGYWIVGAEYEERSQYYNELKYDMPVVLVIGSEGKGISKLVKDNCDFLVKIPMKGHVNSLNASVSCSILIYEIIKYHK